MTLSDYLKIKIIKIFILNDKLIFCACDILNIKIYKINKCTNILHTHFI